MIPLYLPPPLDLLPRHIAELLDAMAVEVGGWRIGAVVVTTYRG